MSKTLEQIYALNPTTTIGDNDLLYLVQSPYTAGTDAGIIGSVFKGLFVSSTAIINTSHGGTGLVAPTLHNLLIGNGTSALTLLPPSVTSGTPLISQGASSDPAYGTASVAGGGTGATSFTAYSVIVAGISATGAFQNVAGVGTSGQQLTSQGPGALPIWSSASSSGTVNPGTANQMAYYATTGDAVSGLTSANNGLLVTSNAGVPSILTGPAANDRFLKSNATSAPSWSSSALVLGGDLTTVGAFTINLTFLGNSSVTFPQSGTLATTAQVITWNDTTGTSATLAANNGYIADNAGLVTYTLPLAPAVGDLIYIQGKGSGGWRINQRAGQQIVIGNTGSTTGVTGFIASTNQFDSICLVCITVNSTFAALGGPQSSGITIS